MFAGLRAVGRGLRHLNQAGYIYVWCNVAWALLSLLIITAPAAWAGMIRLSWTAQRTPTAGWTDFWQGVKENLGRGVLIAIVNLAFFFMSFTNLTSYALAEGIGYALLRGVWVITALVVIMLQFYMWPIYYALEKPSLPQALRNAGVMILLNPLFTVVLLIALALIAALSTILPLAWLLISGGALATVTTAAVIDRLKAAGVLPLDDPVSTLIDPSFTDV